VEVSFAEPGVELAPLRALAGVEVADAADHHVALQVRGDMGPLLAALTRMPVTTIDSREPSLEEIFLIHYRGGDEK